MFDAIVVEGDLEVAIVEGLFRSADIPFDSDKVINKRGVERFWMDAPRFNRAARHKGIFGLADLERHDCAPSLIREKLGGPPHPNFVLRLSVRMSESWLLADRAGIASFLGVSQARIPQEPDTLGDPKQAILDLARNSRKRVVRNGIPPETGVQRRVGFEYLPLLSQFAKATWQPRSAAQRSPSLARALGRLNALRRAATN